MSGKMFLIKAQTRDWVISTKEDATDVIMQKSSQKNPTEWENQGTWYYFTMNPRRSEENERKCECRKTIVESRTKGSANVDSQMTGFVKAVLSASVVLSILLFAALVGTIILMQRRYAR